MMPFKTTATSPTVVEVQAEDGQVYRLSLALAVHRVHDRGAHLPLQERFDVRISIGKDIEEVLTGPRPGAS